MCTLIVFLKKLADYPIIALHNRYERRGTRELPPRVMDGKYRVFCPIDVRSGGTWVGFNERGLFAAVTDQHTAPPVDTEKSRGMLLLEVLREFSSAMDAIEHIKENVREYKRGNFVVADFEAAFHLIHDENIILMELKPGIHVITNLMIVPGVRMTDLARAIFEDVEARRRRAVELASRVRARNIEEFIGKVKEIAADHGEGRSRRSICYHNEKGDWMMTSSTIIAISRDISRSKLLYCSGNPCENPFRDFSEIVQRAGKQISTKEFQSTDGTLRQRIVF